MRSSGPLRLAVRGLVRQPAWTASVVLTLGLGVGANTAVFSLVNGSLLGSLPYPEPERLVMIWEGRPDRGWARFGVSGPAFHDWRRHVSAFESLVAYHESEANFASETAAERVRVASTTADLLPVLGLRPLIGRGFEAADERPASDVVLLSHGFWRRAFGGDPAVLGRSFLLGRERMTVVGVLPPEAGAPFASPDLFRPLNVADERRGARWLTVLGRLAPGRTEAQARAQLDALARERTRGFPDTNAGWTIAVAGLQEVATEGSRTPLLLLSGTVALLLLLACANVAHLLLVRTLGRERELAVRTALGAGVSALVQPVLAEAMVLGVLGGAAGLALGEAVRGLLEQALSSTAPGRGAILEPRVLAFGLATTALTGLLVSVLPVLHVYRSSPAAALRAGGTTLACLGRRRSRRALVVAEVAVAFVLVFAAGILVRTVVGLLREDPGFRSKGVVTFRIAPPQIAPGPDQTEESFVAALLEDRDRVASFYARTVERLRALPAVRAAAAVNRLPLTGGWWVMSFEIPGRPSTTPGDDKPAFGRVVVPGYFHTMGMSLRAGRDFDWGDAAGALPAVIVDEALARREFGNESPLGARLRIDGRAEARVVGVVGSTRFAIDRPGSPTFYVPLAQAEFGFYPDWGMDVVVRSDLESSRLLPLVREAVRDLDASLPLFSVRTLDEVVAASVGTRQGTLRLLGAFSVVALLLAGIGLYGVLAQLARERTREFGIRLALGAPARQLAALVLADGLRLSALGAMLGGLLALGAGRLLASLLHGVGPGDPLTLGAAAALMGAVATIASLPSVRRACRLDPARILRAE